MLGNLLLLVLSWVLLKFSGSDLKVLGLFPTRLRSRQFFSGFLLTAVLAAVYFLGILLVLEAKVSVNSNYSFLDFLKGSWWTIQSVLFEELLFRGALLFLALKYLGKLKGILLSATVFGIYHWFSYNVFGDLVQMLYTFMLTGIGGFVFAYAYVRTKSLYLPIGLHFGWNFVTIVIFSQGIFAEDQLLISSTDNKIGTFGSIISLLYQVVLFPVFSILLIRFLTFKGGIDTSVRNDVLEIPSMD